MHGLSSIEPVFHISDARGIRIANREWSEVAGRYLAHAVVRTPDKLHVHVQRIHFANAHGRTSELYGALIDMFISLGDRGGQLREQMLSIALEQLDGEAYDFLTAALETPLKASSVFPGKAVSVLSKGFIGSPDILTKPKATTNNGHDPLKLAESYVEYGEIHSARAQLEIELLRGRSTAAQEQQLLEIYNTIAEQGLFDSIYALVDKDKLHVPVQWQALANHFSGEYS